jgi:hypothetical protein
VWGVGCRVLGVGCRVQGVGCWVYGVNLVEGMAAGLLPILGLITCFRVEEVLGIGGWLSAWGPGFGRKPLGR